MGQEDFAKLGFEIDITNAQKAFTRLTGRLTELETKTVAASQKISQHLADAFGGKMGQDPMANVSDGMKNATNNISGGLKSATKDAQRYASKILRITSDTESAIQKVMDTKFYSKGDISAPEQAIEAITKIRNNFVSEVRGLQSSMKGKIEGPELDTDKLREYVNHITTLSESIKLKNPKALGEALSFDEGTYKKLVSLYHQEDVSQNPFENITKGLEKLAGLGGDNNLKQVISSIELITSLAKKSDLASFSNALKQISTFEFNDNAAKEIIQRFIELRGILKREDTKAIQPFFNVEKTVQEFDNNLLPALGEMKKKVVAELDKLNTDGIQIPVTFDIEDPEKMVTRANKGLVAFAKLIKAGQTEATWPKVHIKFIFDLHEALGEIHTQLAALPVDQQPRVPVVLSAPSIDAEQMRKAIAQSKGLKELQDALAKPLPIAQIDLAPYDKLLSKLREIQSAIKGSVPSTQYTKENPEAATSSATTQQNGTNAIADMANKFAQATSKLQIKLKAPTIAPVTKQEIDAIIKNAQAILSAKALKTAPIKLSLPLKKQITEAVSLINTMLKGIDVKAIPLKLDADSALASIKTVSERFKALPTTFPVPTIDSKDLDMLQNYAQKIANIAKSLQYLHNVEMILKPIAPLSDVGGTSSALSGTTFDALQKSKADLEKEFTKQRTEVGRLQERQVSLNPVTDKDKYDEITKAISTLNTEADKTQKSLQLVNAALEKKTNSNSMLPATIKALSDASADTQSALLKQQYAKNRADAEPIAIKAQVVAQNNLTNSLKATNDVLEDINKSHDSVNKGFRNSTANLHKFSDTLEMSEQEGRNATRTMQTLGQSMQTLTLNPDSLVDPLKRLRAELRLTNNSTLDMLRSMGMYLSARTVVSYFRRATEAAVTFGYEVRRIQSLATNFDFGQLYKGLMEIDARFGNVTHNARALYWAYSSGVRGTEEELVRFTEIMSKTATTINADVMPTVDAATGIMNAYGLSAAHAAEVSDMLFTVVKEGKANARELTSAIGNIIATSASLGVSINDLGAAASTLTKTMRTNKAFTYLNNIMGKMIKPTKEIAEYAASLGVEFSASAVKARGFAAVMKDLHDATGGNVAMIAKLFPDLRGQRAAVTLLSTQYQDFVGQIEKFENKAGNMEEALGKIADTPEAQFKALRNALYMLSIEAGNSVRSLITLGGALEKPLEFVNAMSSSQKEMGGRMMASAGVFTGYILAQKAMAAAHFVAVQSNMQLNLSSLEESKVRMQSALNTRQQITEIEELNLKKMEEHNIAVKNNSAVLQEIRSKKIVNQQNKEAFELDAERLKLARQQAGITAESAIGKQLGKIDQDNLALAELKKQRDILQNDNEIKKAKDARTLELITARAHTAALADIRKKELAAGIEYTKEMDDAFTKAGQAKYYKGVVGKENPLYAQLEEQEKSQTAIAYGSQWQSMSAESRAGKDARIAAATVQAKNAVESLNTVTKQKIGIEQLATQTLDELIKSQKTSLDADRAALSLTKNAIKDNAIKQHVMEELNTSGNLLVNTEERLRLAQAELSEKERLGLPGMEQEINAQRAKVNAIKAELVRIKTDTQTMSTNADLNVKQATANGTRKGNRATDAAKKQLDEYTELLNKKNVDMGAKPYTMKPILSEELQLLHKQIAAKDKLIALSKDNIQNGKSGVEQERNLLELIKERNILERKRLNKEGMGVLDAGKAAGRSLSGISSFTSMSLMRVGGAMGGPASMLLSMLPVNDMLAQSIGTANAAMIKMGSGTKGITKLMLSQKKSAAELSASLMNAGVGMLFSSKAAEAAGFAEAELALARKLSAAAAAGSIVVITAIATAIWAFLTYKTKNGGPMAGIANWMVGLDKIKERGTTLDNYQEAIKERIQNAKERDTQLELSLKAENREGGILYARLQELKQNGATQEEIEDAQRDLYASRAQSDFLRTIKQNLNAADTMPDTQALTDAKDQHSAAAEQLAKLKKEWEEIRQSAFLQDISSTSDLKEKILAAKAKEKSTSKELNLQTLKKEQLRNDANARENSNLRGKAALEEIKRSHEDLFMLEKTAAEQLDIQKKRKTLMEEQQKALLDQELLTIGTNFYAAYAKKVQNMQLTIEKFKNAIVANKAALNDTELGKEEKKDIQKDLETAEKDLENAEATQTKFVETFGKLTEGIAEMDKNIAFATIKKVQEANKELERQAKKNAFENDETSAAILRDIEMLKNWVDTPNGAIALLEKTKQDIVANDKAQKSLTNKLKYYRNNSSYQNTSMQKNLKGLQAEGERLRGLEAIQRDAIQQHEDEMLSSRVSLAKTLEGQYKTLIKTQQNIQKLSTDLDTELWDKLIEAPGKGWMMMQKNIRAQYQTLQQSTVARGPLFQSAVARLQEQARIIGTNEKDMILNRAKLLNDESKEIRKLKVKDKLNAADTLLQKGLSSEADQVKYVDLLTQAQEGLPEALSAMKKEISLQKTLADAEQKANQEAQSLAKQLNETFGTTVQSRFDSRSVESFKLMNRAFDPMRVGANTKTVRQDEYEKYYLNMLTYAETNAKSISDALQQAEQPLLKAIQAAGIDNAAILKKATENFSTEIDKFGKHVGAMPSISVVNI